MAERDGTLNGKPRLDDVDFAILRLLQRDGRMPNADVARNVGLSPPSVLQRIRKLEACGYVKGYMALLDHERLGFGLLVIAMVSLSLHQEKAIDRFRYAIVQIPEVVECLHVSGEHDYLLKILVKDMASYEKLVREELSTIPGIGKIHSSFVLGVNKSSSRLPI
ncbi:MAG: Lrp/AsnC family transcriptional regulator [Fimbriimonadaceae bacterium]|nr:Lrp/AsnC family transcriptional regulator [Fimbriimonadaceae bacterium]QYK54763.1 MAG: Lrp/AsnC family transcriptional regulator [Fimbriimonadaceae bacterium]